MGIDGKEVKELSKKDLGVAKDPWISSGDMVVGTTQPVVIGTDHNNELGPDRFYILREKGIKVADCETILQRDDQVGSKAKMKYSVFTKKDGSLMCVGLKRREFIHGKCIYHYRTQSTFDGQEPSKETIGSLKNGVSSSPDDNKETKSKEEEGPYDNHKLYLWARLVFVLNDDYVRRSLINFAKVSIRTTFRDMHGNLFTRPHNYLNSNMES